MPFLSIGERKLYYKQTLPSSDALPTTLVFVHGLGSSSSSFAPVIPSLAAAGYTCIAIDNHGMGLSPFAGHAGEDQLIDDVLAVMTAFSLSPENTVVVGHSLGGLIANGIALRRRVAALVLLGPVDPSPALASIFEGRIAMASKGMDDIADLVVSMGPGPQATDLQRALIRALVLCASPEGYVAACRTIIDSKSIDYARMTCPVLIVAGRHDRNVPPPTSEAMFERWGCEKELKRFVVIEHIAHWHCVEAPQEVTTAMLDFLSACVSK